MRASFRKTFYLRGTRPKKNGKVGVEVKITITGKIVHFYTGIDVSPELWIPSVGKQKGNNADSRLINKMLDAVMEEIDSFYNSLLAEHGYVHPAQIKEAILNKRSGKLSQKEEELRNKKNFFDYFDEVNTMKKMEVSQKTYSRYLTTKERFSVYFTKITKKKPQQIEYSDLTPTLINGFYYELMNKYKIENNMAMKYMQKLKCVVAHVMEEEEQKIKNPFRKFKFRFEESDRHFLSQEQIESLMTRQFKSEQLQRVRDMFIFSCFTGLSFVEMSNLVEEDIIKSFDGSIWIKDKRQKTKSEYRVRLMKVPSLILEKYAGTGKKGRLLPMYCNKVMNEVLHQIGQICEIEQDITFHVGRHSFATLCLTMDVPLETVSKMLGHKSIKTTQIYARVIDKKLSKDMESMEQNINNLAISSEYTINF